MGLSYRFYLFKCFQKYINFTKLKFILNRNCLSKIYLTFTRPILEYGCKVWNGCGVELTDKLEKLQLEAAKFVTGLPVYDSRDSLYLETGWEKLIDRCNRRCICFDV